ncbi:MAG TPA: phenylalanine--tRNA ligase subunit beta, partial [Nitrososphaerales archaeon]|nr:phenylalanine--tRNA ligase subunit beta [Nitrososphaerales archaeon]
LGLDIEDQAGDVVSVEYSPNRPDFSSEAGIARSLVGLLGIITGPPRFEFPRSKFKVTVSGKEILNVRPFIQGLYAEISVTDEIIKQLITMQEDLHNGIGRRRSKVAIGIHNASVISSSIRYYGVTDGSYSFVPLGSTKRQSIKEILASTDQGVSYGKLLSRVYPMLEDSNANVLSMPPIINGELTRLSSGISKLFVDVTGTDEYIVDASTAIIASMLSDVGARVFTIEISRENGEMRWVPDMSPRTMSFDLKLSNEILGFDFDHNQAKDALEKSRLGLDSEEIAIIPRFRSDIIHPIDLAEEIALGYGISRMTPQVVSSSLAGSLKPRLQKIDSMIEILIGLELTEIWNLSLTTKELIAHSSNEPLRVDDSKSQSFEYLRCDVISSLLQVLGGTSHEEYPQMIFEEAPVFSRSNETVSGVSENEHLAVTLADSGASYTMIRSKLDAFLRTVVGEKSVRFEPASDQEGIFASGRTAIAILTKDGNESKLGLVGEISPATLEKFGISVPVVGFEINLEPLLKG